MKKIGVMGGTFNPVHFAHLILASQAMEQFMLDEVWFMPSKHPPHKDNGCIVSDAHRLNMLCLAIASRENFVISDFELRREGLTYSADTFRLLAEKDDGNKYYLIIGGDSLMDFESWRDPGLILKYAGIIASARGGIDNRRLTAQINKLNLKYGGDVQLLSVPAMDISSEFIRRSCAMGKDISYYLPSDVASYISDNHLYEDSEILRAKESLRIALQEKRYLHTLGVADTASALASENNYDPVKAYLAGILHDCAKAVPAGRILEEADKCGIPLTEVERRRAGALVHAKLGEFYAEKRFDVTDRDILDAIRFHTTGRPGMGLLEKIIFTADYIEPGREMKTEPPLPFIRAEAHRDIDRAVYYVLENMVRYLESTGGVTDNATVEAYDYYREAFKSKNTY